MLFAVADAAFGGLLFGALLPTSFLFSFSAGAFVFGTLAGWIAPSGLPVPLWLATGAYVAVSLAVIIGFVAVSGLPFALAVAVLWTVLARRRAA